MGTSNAPATKQATPAQQGGDDQAQQRLAGLGLPKLVNASVAAATAVANWVYGNATGRRGLTVAGTYHGAAVVAQLANNGQAVTTGHIASMYLALGAVAPGRAQPTGYAHDRGFTVWHSAQYGANKHTVGLAHGKGTDNGAPTYSVPSAVLQSVAKVLPPTALATLAQAAQANLDAAVAAGCGCNAKHKPCATGRKVGNARFAALAK